MYSGFVCLVNAVHAISYLLETTRLKIVGIYTLKVLWLERECINRHLCLLFHMLFSLLNYSYKKWRKQYLNQCWSRKANPFKKAAVLINMHWPRIAYYVVNITIWHSWLRRDNLEMSGYPFSFSPHVKFGSWQTKTISSQEDMSEPQITMLDLWYIGNTYLYFERMQYKLWWVDLQCIKQGSKGTEYSS